MSELKLAPWLIAASMLATSGAAQQVADSAYAPPIARPAFAPGAGPVVAIDEAHNNFHTADGRYLPFASLLRRDGWRVERSRASFTSESLRGVRVLVVANALADRNVGDWTLPTPSAFSADEIDAVDAWVRGGGALLLIADHMPFPGAAADLACRFGFEMRNGFAMDTVDPQPPIVFRRADGTLRLDAFDDETIPPLDSVASFTGQAFRALADDVVPILVLPAGIVSLEPDEAWIFDETTPRVPVGGWLQGAARRVGAGRVVVMGEAAMFSAQLGGEQRTPAGMNAPVAGQNYRLALAVVRWLGD